RSVDCLSQHHHRSHRGAGSRGTGVAMATAPSALEPTPFDEPELWRVNLGTAFSDLVPGTLDHQPPPEGALHGGPLGGVSVFTVSGTPQTVRRTTTAVR